MTTTSRTIHRGRGIYQPVDAPVRDRFATIGAARYAVIENVDRMAPFLVTIVSDSDVWLFAGSNGPFTAGRRDPDTGLFPYRTVDQLLRHASSSGARTSLLLTRHGSTALWEPWLDDASVYRITRTLYKRVDGTELLYEEVNHDLGARFRTSLAACGPFGVTRRSEITELSGDPIHVRYLDGLFDVIPPGIGQDVYARMSYLAAAYMRHERVPGTTCAVYALGSAISDRPEPSESLRVSSVWSVGHRDPTILLSDRQLSVFRRGGDVVGESEVRGEVGAYLAVDSVALNANGSHAWFTVGDTAMDHPAVIRILDRLSAPDQLPASLHGALSDGRARVRHRVAAADGLQRTADEAVNANHYLNVLFNLMRGGSVENGYLVPVDDLARYLESQNRIVRRRSQSWLTGLPPRPTLRDVSRSAEAQGDPQLTRLVRAYLPLTFSRRHGDPSRPWNRFTIHLRDSDGRPVFGYEGNWRDIFQNWEAIGHSFPGLLPAFVNVFLNASTADGYNPYRITRSGLDWEVEDPDDPWSHIGYWGDHQIVYVLRLLEAAEDHAPGTLAAALNDRGYAYADVPYRIGSLEAILANPRATIEFDRADHDRLVAAASELGADGKLRRGADGEVQLVTLAEKLLVPVLVKLTNFVPGGGIWLNTQRPEWNDANNALAGWGLSLVTLSAIRRYLDFIDRLVDGGDTVELSGAVAELLARITGVLDRTPELVDDATRYRVLTDLGRAGEAHRQAVYGQRMGDPVLVPVAEVRRLVAAARPLVDAALRGSRRDDGLYHSYNVLRIERQEAAVDHLGLMLEGQVAILESGLLAPDESLALLRALRASDLYRPDQHTYLLYPDRDLAPFLERNTLVGEPPLQDPSLFVADPSGRWHFQSDLSTIRDVERQLDRLGAGPDVRSEVLELWSDTFAHDRFIGRSGTFFMFEGLGSVYWHMIAKLLLATQACHRRAGDATTATALREIHDDIRDGLNFRKSAAEFGAFPIDAHSHTPGHRGAQQPGMTGQVKEQILTRFGELGVLVVDGRVRFDPRLLHESEFIADGGEFAWCDVDGMDRSLALAPSSLAFTYCQVPVCYVRGDFAEIELERRDGSVEIHPGRELSREVSRALFERHGEYRRITVRVA